MEIQKNNNDNYKVYTPDLAGSGQFGICVECGLGSSTEGWLRKRYKAL